MKPSIYGYCRISTKEQNIERQVRNITASYPNATIVKEVYTGKDIVNRQELNKLIKKVSEGDIIVFDSVSRMSRNATEGFELYKALYDRGISLIFLKEPHINTDTYKKALSNKVSLTGNKVDVILKAVNEYFMLLASEQIELAFEQAQKEVDDLSRRTIEGIQTARLNGKQIGNVKGTTLVTKKSIEAKKSIRKYSKSFDGTLGDSEVIKLSGISRNSYYKYKKELTLELMIS